MHLKYVIIYIATFLLHFFVSVIDCICTFRRPDDVFQFSFQLCQQRNDRCLGLVLCVHTSQHRFNRTFLLHPIKRLQFHGDAAAFYMSLRQFSNSLINFIIHNVYFYIYFLSWAVNKYIYIF